MTHQSQVQTEYCQGGAAAWDEVLHSTTLQPSLAAEGGWGAVSPLKLGQLSWPMEICAILTGNGRSHPVTHPSSYR